MRHSRRAPGRSAGSGTREAPPRRRDRAGAGKGRGSARTHLHLSEVAQAVARGRHAGLPGAQAVLHVAPAGWHLSTNMIIPAPLTIPPLHPVYHNLQQVGNIWQSIRVIKL